MRADFFIVAGHLVRVDKTAEHLFRQGGGLAVGSDGPKDGRGVADLHSMGAAFFEEAIERRRIGEGCGFGDRGVIALFVAIGGEGVEIE